MFFKRYRSFNIKSKNIIVLYIATFFFGLTFFAPIWALYIEESLFSVVNVAVIIAIQSLTAVVLEVPTGAIADLFGRRNTVILGAFGVLASTIFLYIGGSMVMFILYAILSAVGGALASGADDALIYDTLKSERKEKHYKHIIGTLGALWPLGAVIGSLGGGYLASVSLSFPVLITIIPFALGFLLTFFLKEPKYHKEKEHGVLKQMHVSCMAILKNRQIILLMAAGFLFWGLGESIHLLKSIYFLFKDIPIVQFGYIFALTFGFSSLGHYSSAFLADKFGEKKMLIMTSLIDPLLIIISTLTWGLFSALFLILPSISFGIRNPILNHMLNKEVSSRRRATVLSINSLMWQFGKVIFAPFVGWLADLYSINTAFMITGGLMLSGFFVLLGLKQK